MTKNILKLRIILWLILGSVVFWILYMGIVPTGKISYDYNFKKENRFFGKLTPQDRVENPDKNTQKIIGDPVYFSLWTPRRFEKAKLTLKYKNKSDFSIIEAGVLADNIVWRYDLEPIENKIINQIGIVWDKIYDGDLMLLQKEKKYESIEEFLKNTPERDEIALYNYDFKKEYILKDYESENIGLQEKNVPTLRGSYQFWTYIKEEDLDFKFIFEDLNENDDNDFIDLTLYYNDQVIDSTHIDDDETNKDKNVDFRFSNLPEGVYKVELRANDDIITKKIFSAQNKISFLNNIRIYKSGQEDIKIWTDSRIIYAKTINPGSLQDIKIGEKVLNLNEVYKQFSVETKEPIYAEIILEKDGITLAGRGVFSFDEKELINPSFKKIANDTDIKGEEIKYVLTKYNAPREDGEWKIAEAEFDLTQSYREKGKFNFVISIPGLRADDDIDDYFEISEIKIELEGKSLIEKIKNIF